MFRAYGDDRVSRGTTLTSGILSVAISLNVDQLGEGLRSMGVKIKVSEAKVLAEDMDDSGDGEITLAEFSDALNKRQVTWRASSLSLLHRTYIIVCMRWLCNVLFGGINLECLSLILLNESFNLMCAEYLEFSSSSSTIFASSLSFFPSPLLLLLLFLPTHFFLFRWRKHGRRFCASRWVMKSITVKAKTIVATRLLQPKPGMPRSPLLFQPLTTILMANWIKQNWRAGWSNWALFCSCPRWEKGWSKIMMLFERIFSNSKAWTFCSFCVYFYAHLVHYF